MLKKLILSLFIITLAGPGFAASGDYVVYTWGYGDIMYNMLQAVKGVIGSGNFKMALRLAMMLSILVIALSLMSDRTFSPFVVGQKVILVILLQVLLTSAPHDVYIFDETRDGISTTPAYKVDNLPAVIGLPLYIISNIERGLSHTFRDSLAATSGGIIVGNADSLPITSALNMLQSVSSFRISDPNFMRTLSSFVENCVVPDVISGYIDIYELGSNPNFWNSLSIATHPVRVANNYMANTAAVDTQKGIDGDIQTCPNVYNALNDLINRYTLPGGKAWQQIAGSLGLAAGTETNRVIGGIASDLFGYAQGGSSLLMNAIAINSFNDSYRQIAALAGLDASSLSYGMAKSQEIARVNSTMSGIMAKKYLPVAKGYLTVIFIAIIPIIFVIAIATGSFKKPVGMITGLLMALALWTIGDQLLDFIILIRTKSLFTGLGGMFNLQTQPILESGLVDSLSLSLSMYWMIPTLSFAVASMSGYAASSMMSGVGRGVMAGVGGTAGEAAAGSRSIGIVRENMINTNKYDVANSVSAGTGYKYGVNYSSEFHNDYTKSSNSVTQEKKQEDYSTSYNADKIRSQNNIDTAKNELNRSILSDTSNKKLADKIRSNNNIDEEKHLFDRSRTENFLTSKTIGSVSQNLNKSVTDHTLTSNYGETFQYSGIVKVGNEVGNGVLKGVGNSLLFNGELGGKKAFMIINDAEMDMEKDSVSIKSGAAVMVDKESGSTETKHLNALMVKGGHDVGGYNAANAMLKAGLSQFISDHNMREAFTKNNAEYLNSFNTKQGNVALNESQAMGVTAGIRSAAKAGINFFGVGADIETSVGASIQATLNHNSGTVSSVDLNRIFSEEVARGLLTDKANGAFNDHDGTFNSNKFDEEARIRYGALEKASKEAYHHVYGPGNGTQYLLSAAKKGIVAAKECVEDFPKTPSGGGSVYKDKDGKIQGRTWREPGKGWGKD